MESKDFYFENNCIVLTESFLKKRGFCCHNNCRHCPYKNMKTRYILKTSNDLQFDFGLNEKIKLIEIDSIEEDWVSNLEYYDMPFKVEIEEEEYTIIRLVKIREID